MNRALWSACMCAALCGCSQPEPTPPWPAPIRANLDVDDVLTGADNTFVVRDAPPNSLVRLFASTRPPGSPEACFAFAGGACLDIPGPIQRVFDLGQQTTDAAGTASFDVRVPRNVPATAYMQSLGFVDGAFWATQVVTPIFVAPDDDLDGDGLYNATEFALGTHIRMADTDGDGASDSAEVAAGTDPLVADTDGGGALDGEEIASGSDPLDASDDLPTPPPICPAETSLNTGALIDGAITLEVWTGNDTHAGSCHDSSGGDASLRFTPPTPGLWRIRADASVGTVLSVRSDCDAPATEQACHEPALAADAGEVWVDLDGSEVTLLVERRSGLDAVPVMVSALPAAAPVPPTLDSVLAVCGDALGIDLTATPGDAPLAQVHLTARSATGSTTDWTVDLVGSELRETFPLPALTTAVDVELEDQSGIRSAVVTAACTAPTQRSLGETCDPGGVFDQCDAGACADGTCTLATAPTLLQVSATANDDLGRLGLQLLGTDPDQDVRSVRVTLLDVSLQPVSVVTADLDILGTDPFVGVVVAQLAGEVPHGVSIEAVDAAGLMSAPLVTVVEDPTALSEGASCDVTETFGLCPVDCVPDAAPDGPATCTEAPAACPVGWAGPSPTATGTDTWTLSGTTEGEPWHTPGGTCGGAGPQVITSFTATTGGLYRATLTPDLPGATGILQARRRCSAPTSAAELLCDTAPRLLDLAAGETVHLLIAGTSPVTSDGSLGAFTLTLAREL